MDPTTPVGSDTNGGGEGCDVDRVSQRAVPVESHALAFAIDHGLAARRLPAEQRDKPGASDNAVRRRCGLSGAARCNRLFGVPARGRGVARTLCHGREWVGARGQRGDQ